MYNDDDELVEEKSFKNADDGEYSDLDEPLEPLEESDLGLDEEEMI